MKDNFNLFYKGLFITVPFCIACVLFVYAPIVLAVLAGIFVFAFLTMACGYIIETFKK